MTNPRNAAPLVRRSVERADTLRPAAYNPRKISKEALKGLQASIERWGVVQDIVVNSRNRVVVGGHQRLAALKAAGVHDVPVTWVDLDEAEEKALNVALNNPHIAGEFDDSLQDLLQSIKDGIGLPAMQDLKLDELLAPVLDVGHTDPDDVPEAPEEPVTKFGDVWLMGNHRLMCGDSTAITDVDRLLAGAKPDMLFTDPPYNVAFNGRSGKHDVILNDDLADDDFEGFIGDVLRTIKALSTPIYYIWCNWRFYATLQRDLEYKACIVWAKNVFGMGRGYRHQHEFCLFNGSIDDKIKNESDLWQIDKDINYVHPTQKPVALSQRALGNHSKAKNIVDLFGGSGSTLIGCEAMSRTAFVMELDPKYCDVIVKRWEDFTGRKAVLDVTNA